MMNQPFSQHKQQGGIEEKTKNYKTELNQRYWDYQRSQFPDREKYFDPHFAKDGDPPVFRLQEAWRNIIINPGGSEDAVDKLLNLIPECEHHKWFRSMNSSQALAQSVLGNLAIHDSLICLTDLQDDEGENLFGETIITSNNFSMEHKIDYLGEPRKTSLDGYISGNYRIAIECKFTESEVGTCSRPRLKKEASNYENEHCDGKNPLQKTRNAPCPLTKIGVLYWEYLPALFKWDNDSNLNTCPLNKNYQLVRNILAIGVKDTSASPENGHVILIYDERNPAFMSGGAGFNAYSETRAALRRPTMLRKCSWQKITHCLRQNNILPWLTAQLDMKYGL